MPLESPRVGVSRPWQSRLTAALLLAGSLAVLLVAALLTADPRGVGTHQHLGLPPCGFLEVTGLPCPTCGYTTATTLAVHGHIAEAFITQPGGALFTLATAMTVLISVWALVTGMSLKPLGELIFRPATMWVIGGIVAGAWLYKIAVVVIH